MKDWDNLKYILAISRHGGLSGAARALSVNHSTVSRRLTSAESNYGVRLFDRLPSGLVPTEEGHKVIKAAKNLELQISSLEMEIMAGDKALAGPLSVTAPIILIQTCLVDIFASFIEQYPEIDLTIIAANDTLNLHRREADVAIRVSDNPDENLFGRRIFKLRKAFYGSKKYLQGKIDKNNRLRPDAEIDYLPFIWWGKRVPDRVAKQCKSTKIAAHFDDMSSLASAVAGNLGISLLPCFIGEADSRLQQIQNLPNEPYRDLWVLTHPELKALKRVRCLMDFVARALEDNKAQF